MTDELRVEAMSDEEKAEAMRRFETMTSKQSPDNGIALGAERERQAIELAQRVIGAAREMIAKGMIQAAGYRVLVKPVEAVKTLEQAEAERYETLAKEGFEVKTDQQKEREERGENHGIVLSIGPVAFERMGGRAAWCDEGDVVVFSRYAGTRVEHPPASGVFYQLMNDEDIFGVIK